MTTPLDTFLQVFDGADTSYLSDLRAALGQEPWFVENLVGLCGSPNETIANGATWILKAELEGGAVVSPQDTARLVAVLPKLAGWQAMLHFCQFAERLPLRDAQALHVIEWAQGLAEHDRPFLRAWALHAIITLGHSHNAPGDTLADALAKAERDPAASVRARARNLRKAT